MDFRGVPSPFSNLVSGAGARTGTSVCLDSAISQQRRWLDMREKFSKSGPSLFLNSSPCPPRLNFDSSLVAAPAARALLPISIGASPPSFSSHLPSSVAWLLLASVHAVHASKQSMVDAVCCPAIFHGNGARLPEEELPLNISGIHAVWTTHTACRLDGILVGVDVEHCKYIVEQYRTILDNIGERTGSAGCHQKRHTHHINLTLPFYKS